MYHWIHFALSIPKVCMKLVETSSILSPFFTGAAVTFKTLSYASQIPQSSMAAAGNFLNEMICLLLEIIVHIPDTFHITFAHFSTHGEHQTSKNLKRESHVSKSDMARKSKKWGRNKKRKAYLIWRNVVLINGQKEIFVPKQVSCKQVRRCAQIESSSLTQQTWGASSFNTECLLTQEPLYVL